MKPVLKWLAILLIAGFVCFGLVVSWLLRWDEIAPPDLAGELVSGSMQHQGRARSWQAYIPSTRSSSPPLLFLLHGSRGDGAYMRASTFYSFDVVAEREGFIPVYPDGFERHWNDCRASASYSANLLNVDDVDFLQALAARMEEEFGVDSSRVYVAGISNGGHLAYRMGMEAPGSVAGIAAIAANLPVEKNLDCAQLGQPVATLIVNGTEDPVNPYGGGVVEILGDTSRGDVRSSNDTAAYWARLAGHRGEGLGQVWPDRAPDDGTTVQSTSPPVQLLTVRGGGHTTPNPVYELPRIVGATSHEFDGAEVIWSFFAGGEPVTPTGSGPPGSGPPGLGPPGLGPPGSGGVPDR
jgi:polyhydroxybutyrate depolymerase